MDNEEHQAMRQQVTGTGKDDEGDITALCGESFTVDKETAIEETLLAGNGQAGKATPYFVDVDGAQVNVRVHRHDKDDPSTRFLRTDSDHTTKNNLHELQVAS